MKFTVCANGVDGGKQWESGEMSREKAERFAYTLKLNGNYAVWIRGSK